MLEFWKMVGHSCILARFLFLLMSQALFPVLMSIHVSWNQFGIDNKTLFCWWWTWGFGILYNLCRISQEVMLQCPGAQSWTLYRKSSVHISLDFLRPNILWQINSECYPISQLSDLVFVLFCLFVSFYFSFSLRRKKRVDTQVQSSAH